MSDWHNVEPLTVLLAERRSLLNLAHRLLYSLAEVEAEAEDVVSEAYARWYGLDDRHRDGRKARYWLGTTVVDLCLMRTGSGDEKPIDDALAEFDDALAMEVASASRDKSAKTLGIGGAPCQSEVHGREEASRRITSQDQSSLLGGRQLPVKPGEGAGRAGPRPVSEVVAEAARRSLRSFRAGVGTPEQARAVVRVLREACEAHDVGILSRLMSPGVSAIFDGGGKIRVPDRPVSGPERVALCLATLLAPDSDVSLAEHGINGRPGLVVRCGREVAATISLDVSAGQVVNAWLVVNPDKLRRLNQL